MYYEENSMEKMLPGRKVEKIFFNEDYLRFQTDKGDLTYYVSGDCCSRSYFHDFIGVKKLLNNGPVIEVKEVALDNPTSCIHDDDDSCVSVYGYQITTEDPIFGLVTSVFSFRNMSNGYYGGWLEVGGTTAPIYPEITDDVLEASENLETSENK